MLEDICRAVEGLVGHFQFVDLGLKCDSFGVGFVPEGGDFLAEFIGVFPL